jgi:hypothetical protein
MFLYAFNDVELMEMCYVTSERILLYFQDVVLKDYPREQYQVAECRKYIRRYLRSLTLKPSDAIHNGPVVSVKQIIMGIRKPDYTLSEIRMNLDFPWFRHVGSIALIKILMSVTHNTLISLRHTVSPTPHNIMLIERCLDKRRLVKSLLRKIISQIPDTKIYPVTSDTTITSISMRIEIADEHRYL